MCRLGDGDTISPVERVARVMAPKRPAPKQQLEQGICGQLGWSSRYFQTADGGRWAVEVRTGVGSAATHCFVSDCSEPATTNGTKEGHAAAAALAVQGLDGLVRWHMAKPAGTMDAAFGVGFDATARTVGSSGWGAFWQQNPRVVGIDVEGNLQTPPVLVQVATMSLVVLESPSAYNAANNIVGAALSPDLTRLLADETILKVFCDGSAGADKRSLGLPLLGRRDIVDLEDVAAQLAGPVNVPRGLARILGLALPQVPVRVEKEKKKGRSDPHSSVMFFGAIEQGRRPQLRGLAEVPAPVRRYAALDAWCTLLAWDGLMREGNRERERAERESSERGKALLRLIT